MEYRVLKGTNLNLSVVTFGTIWFAAAPKREYIDTAEGKRALHLALDEGVNCIHSSYEYKTRHIVLEVLKERHATKKVHHIIKVPSPDRNGGQPTWSPAYMTKLVDDALRELEADRIDLLQWIQRDGSEQDPARSVPTFKAIKDEVRATFEKLRDRGKAGYLGCFVYENEFAQVAARSGLFSALLFYYNLWDTCLLPSFDTFRECGLGIVPFRPFQGGLLTQKRADIKKLPEGDKMNTPRGRQMLQTRDELLRRAGIEAPDLTAYAIKFILACDLVGTIVTGMNTCAQVREILAAVDGKYPPPDVARKVYEAAKELGGPWTT